MSADQQPIDLDAIEARAKAATPGPWEWYGNTDHHNVYLSSVRYGRQFVMGFRRWGMRSAQPAFAVGRTWEGDPPQSSDDFGDCGCMTGAADLIVVRSSDAVRYEVAPTASTRNDPAVYRADISGIRHPDAVFIAAARQDVADLLAEVKRLRAELAGSAAVGGAR